MFFAIGAPIAILLTDFATLLVYGYTQVEDRKINIWV